MTNLNVEQQAPELQEWLTDQDLDDKEKTLWNFELWMREQTTLQQGSIFDYVKYVAEMLDDAGELGVEKSEIDSNHRRAAYGKFQDYMDSESFAKTNTKGETTK